jgi:tetratricopeptide (TPR) repeat protein
MRGSRLIMSRMSFRNSFYASTLIASASLLAGCQSLVGPPVKRPSASSPSQPGAPQPAPGTAQPQPQPGVPSAPTPTQPQKQFRLGSASAALVKQAHAQTGKADFGGAAATVERALRIEPENPLLWIELGQVHLAEGNAPTAEQMGRKAVALATGDPNAQSASWRLIGDALRVRGRTLDATEAYQRANAAVPR